MVGFRLVLQASVAAERGLAAAGVGHGARVGVGQVLGRLIEGGAGEISVVGGGVTQGCNGSLIGLFGVGGLLGQVHRCVLLCSVLSFQTACLQTRLKKRSFHIGNRLYVNKKDFFVNRNLEINIPIYK